MERTGAEERSATHVLHMSGVECGVTCLCVRENIQIMHRVIPGDLKRGKRIGMLYKSSVSVRGFIQRGFTVTHTHHSKSRIPRKEDRGR